jgi:hypothetical protein
MKRKKERKDKERNTKKGRRERKSIKLKRTYKQDFIKI